MSFLEIRHFSVSYGSENILRDISFSLEEGTILGILGANGCGKTTLLKALCEILPHKGEAFLDGENLKTLSPKKMAGLCHYVPQKSGLSLSISARDVVLMGFNPRLKWLEYPDRTMKRKATEALERVGLGDWTDADFQTLSEGQKQLCVLARTLVDGGKMLFLDEPESALDFGGRYRLMELVRNWVTENRRGALVTLHDPQLALNSCDRLLLLKEGMIAGTIFPKTDSLEETEEKLRTIYGALSVAQCENKAGEKQWVLLKEADHGSADPHHFC